MKKKMIYLFLIIVTLGSLSLAIGWHQYRQQQNEVLMENSIAQITPQISPQTMTHFLKSSF